MSIQSNASMIPRRLKWLVFGFAILACVIVGVVFVYNPELAHHLWKVIGIVLALIAVYLFYLRVRQEF